MSAREKILSAIAANKPRGGVLPDISFQKENNEDLPEKFSSVVVSIGGRVFPVRDREAVKAVIEREFPHARRIIAGAAGLEALTRGGGREKDAHAYEDVDVAILDGGIAVAENGAVWLGEGQALHRALPFICQDLVLVIDKSNIVADMHDAYEQLGAMESGFGVFVAGPSKTADIEQSLVLGAHGPKSLTVFIV